MSNNNSTKQLLNRISGSQEWVMIVLKLQIAKMRKEKISTQIYPDEESSDSDAGKDLADDEYEPIMVCALVVE
jgi:hypothetical protein